MTHEKDAPEITGDINIVLAMLVIRRCVGPTHRGDVSWCIRTMKPTQVWEVVFSGGRTETSQQCQDDDADARLAFILAAVEHRQIGIFIASGPGIEKDVQTCSTNLVMTQQSESPLRISWACL